ncbi:UDP-N-acetylglucosamine 1-carboxyvinyltransferase [Pyrinomonas methylaliphatogenes]|jgi:UDP-N-acetylglucosamine 1-carboxyvinyltransferase|uniref:UDP-N-acetylglucosamine 1-carboxyvinyltransferase n=1 Tax=Pyrinomonas methylaliphatogenes TaxID=454194 RepID=A0A0B6X1Y8_9BACT|nr:UDP-N-acetylglucosamine 1-carboxyvinyltransferase [Pyrinomonas methylaliphatogenes]CDM67007.1 UDP-N-acetylglucosamine 1-carboxyvinyltransferase [Pyrinomonas methylaliphatogenes]
MDKFYIQGGRELRGQVRISGAKNSALPCMAAALLTAETVTLHNVPYVRDCMTLRRLLEDLGATVLTPELHTHKINAAHVELFEAPYDLVKTMRASVLVLGPLVARFGRARVSLPGGCAIGTRPIDLHLEGLRQLGAEISLEAGYVVARIPNGERLRGTEIEFSKVTVTGTENLMMAATLARGKTVLRNAAREPEVSDLAALLNRMGARVRGAGTSVIEIEGVEALGGAEHRIIPDRIETGTFLVAAAITRGELELKDCCPEHLTATIEQLREVGVTIEELDQSTLRVAGHEGAFIARDVVTEPYPGFPTDMQAQYMALMTQAEGEARITETIFENRFMHAAEMRRMGARIEIEGRTAIVHGPTRLMGANVQASDLRASASLVLAGLAAEGETVIDRVYHIDRGYERIEDKLRAVGARIERMR